MCGCCCCGLSDGRFKSQGRDVKEGMGGMGRREKRWEVKGERRKEGEGRRGESRRGVERSL